jgi:hypothetical protein
LFFNMDTIECIDFFIQWHLPFNCIKNYWIGKKSMLRQWKNG